jgi:hypothetical protein
VLENPTWLERAEKRAFVSIIRQELENQLWPLSNEAIVKHIESGKDARGKPLKPLDLAYLKALRWCRAIDESAEWSDWRKQKFEAALHRCALHEANTKRARPGNEKSRNRLNPTETIVSNCIKGLQASNVPKHMWREKIRERLSQHRRGRTDRHLRRILKKLKIELPRANRTSR